MKKSIKVLFIICTIVFIVRGFGYAACPSWTQISGTQYSMVVYGNVYVDGVMVNSAGFVLAAFGPGGESDCRAVNNVTDTGGGYLTIVSNTPGETITFKLCNSNTDEVSNIVEQVTFVIDDTQTMSFNTGCTTDAQCDNGDVCDGSETCNVGTGECQAGTALVCDDCDACNGAETCDPTDGCQAGTALVCDDGDVCNGAETCDPNSGCQAGTDLDCSDNNDCTDDLCDPNTGCMNLPDFENVLYATGQEYDGNSQIVEVMFGLDSGAGTATFDSDNWSQDNIVGLYLIDEAAVTNNNIDPVNDLMTADVRPSDSIGQSVAWYVMVENAADPNESDYYPVLSWDLSEFVCMELDGNPCVYELRSGLSTSGTVLVADMTDANSYQTVSQDGDPNQYFTILMTCEPEPEPPRKSTGKIFPWPGIYPGSLGWGLPVSAGFPGGLPYPMTSGYAPGLSIPSFPGTYPGYTYPGSLTPWTSYAWTSYVPRFPVTFPVMGIFSPVGQYGWPINYWTGYPRPYNYQTGWFYKY